MLLAVWNVMAAASSLPAGFIDTTLPRPDGLAWNGAQGIVVSADGRAFIWERAGRVWIAAGPTPSGMPLIDVSDEVSTIGSLGLTGFALDPQFQRNGYFYLFYAVEPQRLANCDTPSIGPEVCGVGYRAGQHASSGATLARLVRYQLIRPAGAQDYSSANVVDYASRRILLGETPVVGGSPTGCVVTDSAQGSGALAFGSDGTLFASCGDGASATEQDAGSDSNTQYQQALDMGLMTAAENVGAFRAQLVDSLSGKILRLDAATGDGVAGNPFYDATEPRAPRSRVWELGLHDPQHFTVRPGSGSALAADARPGTLYIGDRGYSTWESLVVASAERRNYGGPLYEGVGNALTDYSALSAPVVSELLVRDRPAIDWLHGGADARWAGFGENGEPLAVTLGTRAPNGALVSGPLFDGSDSIGGAWYQGSGFPATDRNVYFHADSVGQWIKAFEFDAQDNPVAVRDFLSSGGPICALAADPIIGGLYYISGVSGSEIHHVTYVPSAVTAAPAATPAVIVAPTPASTTSSTVGQSTVAQSAHNSVTASSTTTPKALAANLNRSILAASQTSGLSNGDIGAVGAAGSYSLSGGVYTVNGSGADIWGSTDAFQFVEEGLSGNGSITARVVSQTNTSPWAKAGVMIRETLATGATDAFVAITPSNGVVYQVRSSTGGGSSDITYGPIVSTPYWVRLVRAGNVFTAYLSPNGSTWTSLGQTTITMASSAYVGLAVSSHDAGVLSTALFDNVTIVSASSTTPPPSVPTGLAASNITASGFTLGWSASSDTGGPGLGGYYVYSNGGSTPIATVTSGTSYPVTGLNAATTYSFQVAAFDTATPANVSAPSSALSVTTQSGGSSTVSVEPTIAAITLWQSQQFTATVTAGGGATWYVDTVQGGNSTVGTISGTGLYTPGSAAGTHSVVATSVSDPSMSSSAIVAVTGLTGVFTYHNDLYRDGANTQEYALTPANVNTTSFGKLYSCTADGAIYAQPLWVANVTVNGAQHNVVFVATAHDSLFAFDADADPCVQLWTVSLIDSNHGGTSGETTVPSGPTGHLVGSGDGDISPEVGVIGTPVIDPDSGTLYVVSKSVNSAGNVFYQRLHAIDVTTGSELPGSPVLIAGTYPGSGDGGSTDTFNPRQENQRSGLALVNGVVYIAWASHEDTSPWYGWMMGYSYDGSSFTRTAVFNVTPNKQNGGIWMAGGAPAADSSNNLYFITGNGFFDATSATAPNNDYGDSMLKLTSALSVASYFTPTDQNSDYMDDQDFGSGGAAVLADLPAGSPIPRLVMGGGKDSNLYVLNRDALGGSGDAAAVQKIDLGHSIFATGAFWNNYFYLVGGGGPMTAYQLNPAIPQFTRVGSSSNSIGWPGSTPSISAAGTNNGLVWAVNNNSYCTNQSGACGPAVLHAYNATNVTTELWNSSKVSTDVAGNAIKFTLPTIANGKVYLGTRGNNTGGVYGSTTVSGELDVYGLTSN
ncbi:MAG: PQQ-dependent sugar dehydrogenase [Steroidobacteraceae bacterium]